MVRLTQKKIETVVRSVAGDDVLPLVKKLSGKENISEFKLADQLKIDIKRVRNMLYRLYEMNLVTFTRRKDKKKGWYIYYWTFKPNEIKFVYIKLKKDRLMKLRERVEKEKNEQFFICPTECVRLNFDQTVNFEFHCPECGELTQQQDMTENVKALNKEINELESELKKEKIKI